MSASTTVSAGTSAARPPVPNKAAETKPKLDAKAVFQLLKQTYTEWTEDKAPRLGAAFAYYTIFSMAPLLMVAIGMAGIFFGEEAARGQIQQEIQNAIGPDAARSIEDMIENAGKKKSSGIVASVMGVLTLLLGASALFGQLQDSLNTIWEVAPKPGQGIWATIKARFLSFTMVLGIGFMLLISLALSAAISSVSTFVGDTLPIPEWSMHILNLVISFALVTVFFAMIYKILPDAEVQWHDVWVGAAITSLLFAVGKFALGLYLGKSGVSSSYGAAGSLVLLLLWVYYAAQILFFGAEFTQVYANSYGSKVQPAANAVPVSDEQRAKQGMPRSADLHSAKILDELPDGVQSVEIWKPGMQAAQPAKNPKSAGHVGPVDSRDLSFLSAAFAGFLATVFLFRRNK
jgi:membrane protein